MLRLKNIEVGLVCLVIFISLPRFCAAQTGAFPAFAPESETTPEAEPAPADARKALFPTDEGEASPGKKAAFPVETTGLPDEPQTTPAGKSLSLEEIGLLLGELDLEFSTLPQRHDFLYQADLEDQVLELFFSVYLSEDGSQLRIRAWLDALPANVDVQDHLLGLLARNTTMKQGLHFGYNAETRRLLLETVIPNQNVSSETLGNSLVGVSREVADSWKLWSTAAWATPVKRVVTKPELDSRATDFSNDIFEMPVRR